MLHCQGTRYRVGVNQGSERDYATCCADDLTIIPPVGGAFTGTMFGIYAFGNGEPVLDPADFTDIKTANYLPVENE